MNRFFIVMVSLLLIAPSVTFGQTRANKSDLKSKDQQALLRQLENWIEAFKRNDIDALKRIMAADFALIASDGKVLSREQDLEPLISGGLKFESMVTNDVNVFVYGNTAIVTGIGTYQINFKGQQSTIRERFYDIYQKRKGQWLVIASRPSAAPKEKSAN